MGSTFENFASNLHKTRNQLLERHQAIDALKTLNAELELRVENRTVELSRQTEELKQTLSELKQAQSSLVQSEKMSALGRLVGGVAHEINNPTNFIAGNFEYAADCTQSLLKLANIYRQQCSTPTPEIAAILDSRRGSTWA